MSDVTFPIGDGYDYKVNSIYGWRNDPLHPGQQQYHGGVDIVGKTTSINGASVLSMQSGTVIYSGNNSTYGNVVIIQNSNGTSFLYAHMQDGSTNDIHKGDLISQGEQIGLVGNTGRSTGSHLHLEYLTESASKDILNNGNSTSIGIWNDSSPNAPSTPQRMNPTSILNSAKQGTQVGYNITNETGLSNREFLSDLLKDNFFHESIFSGYNRNVDSETGTFQMQISDGENSEEYKAYESSVLDERLKEYGLPEWEYQYKYLDEQTITNENGKKVTLISSNDKVSIPNTPSTLPSSGGSSVIGKIASWIGNLVSSIGFASTLKSPLVLDLDKDGIELLHADKGVYFDIDNDQFAEQVGWVKPDDGQLAMDRNNNGIIDNITELYGDDVMPAFDKLRLEDSNKDNVIDAKDANYSKLLVWRDLDSDGQTDAGELKTLAQTGITSISLNVQAQNSWLQENYISGKATFTMNGVLRDIYDVHYLNNDINSRFVGYGESQKVIEINPATLLMPLSRGYGTMAAMHIALDKDPVLMQMMEDFVNLPAASNDEIYSRVQDILYQWAGVKDFDPTKYATGDGNFIDGRKVAFMDAFMGQSFMQRGQNEMIGFEASKQLNASWEELMAHMVIRFAVQGPLADVFTNAKYDFGSDKLTLGDSFTNILTKADAYSSSLVDDTDSSYYFWTQIGHILVLNKSELGVSTDTIRSKLTQLAGETIYVTDGFYALKGNNSSNIIEGLDSGDYIYGLDGNDTIYGNGNGDYIEAGNGTDTVYGAAGSDRIYGNSGNDTIYGDEGDDQIDGGYGYNKIYGGVGNDHITSVLYKPYYTSLEYDIIDGGDGEDTLYLWGVSDYVINGYTGVYVDMKAGTAGLRVSGSNQYFTKIFSNIENIGGSSKADLIYGDAGNNTVNGEGGNDIIYGEDGDDLLYGEGGSDRVYGGNGNDVIHTSDGGDYLDGGAGIDWIKYSHSYIITGVNVNLQTGKASGAKDMDNVSWADGSTIINIENVAGTNYNDTITGNDADNTLAGRAGNDIISGGGGNDYLEGADGEDTLYGGLGNDRLAGNHGSDKAYGEDGDDIITGWTGDDIFYGGNGNDTLYGNEDNDSLYGDAGNDILDGNIGNDKLYGADGNDILYAGAGNDIADGGVGDDLIYSSTGNDTLTGGLGKDKFILSLSNNSTTTITDFNIANDVIDLSGVSAPAFSDLSKVAVGANTQINLSNGQSIVLLNIAPSALTFANFSGIRETSIINGTNADEGLRGTASNDKIFGFAGNDGLTGGYGADLLDGGDGWDVSSYTDSNEAVTVNLATNANHGGTAEGDILFNIERVFGSNYNDNLTGGTGNDYLYGNNGNDTLTGGSGNDSLFGENGNDIIIGGLGKDTLWGNAGYDNFRYENLSDSKNGSYDTLQDFTIGQDKIDLAGLFTFGIDSFTDLNITQNSVTSETIITANDNVHPSNTDYFELHLKGLLSLHDTDFNFG